MPTGIEGELLAQMIAETEREIHNSAFDLVEDDDDGDTSLEEVEAPDGGTLSDDEVAERNLHGDDDRYPDGRILEGRERDQLASENQELRRRVAEQDAHLNQVVNGPQQLEAAFQQWKEQKYEAGGALYTDENKARQEFYADLRQRAALQQSQQQHIQRSFADAEAEYGDRFVRARDNFNRAIQSNPNNPYLNNIAGQILTSPHPGYTLMQLDMGGSRGLHPDLGLAGARTAPVRNSRPVTDDEIADDVDKSYGNPAIEREIANSVWD